MCQVAPYCASKWAVEGLTRAVAKELSSGVSIVALSPGVVHTEMLESCFGASANVYPKPDQWYAFYFCLYYVVARVIALVVISDPLISIYSLINVMLCFSSLLLLIESISVNLLVTKREIQLST